MAAWIITDRFKALLESLDPDGWEYWPVSTSFHTKTMSKPGPDVWLCDLVRGVRALDDPGVQYPSTLMSSQALRFRSKDIGNAPFFREPAVLATAIFCTEPARLKLVEAGITGMYRDLVGEQHD